MANKPVKKFVSGGINVSIWENEGKNDSKFYTAQIQRSYKDGDEYKNTNTLRLQDLLPVSKLLEKAYDELATKEV